MERCFSSSENCSKIVYTITKTVISSSEAIDAFKSLLSTLVRLVSFLTICYQNFQYLNVLQTNQVALLGTIYIR